MSSASTTCLSRYVVVESPFCIGIWGGNKKASKTPGSIVGRGGAGLKGCSIWWYGFGLVQRHVCKCSH